MAALVDSLATWICFWGWKLLEWALPMVVGYLISVYQFQAQVKMQSASARYSKRRDEPNVYLNLLVVSQSDSEPQQHPDSHNPGQKFQLRASRGQIETLLQRQDGPTVGQDVSNAVARCVAASVPIHAEASLGARCSAQVCYVSGNFSVVGVNIKQVDATAMLPAKERARARHLWRRLMSMLARVPLVSADTALEESVQAQLTQLAEDYAMMRHLPEDFVDEVIKEKGLEVRVEAKTAEDEGGFFFSCLKQKANPQSTRKKQ